MMNKHYVMTDLHGNFNAYAEMLLKIKFDDTDQLYILGDICDRGPASAEIYLDVMNRKNVFCIKGNHEKMALEGLEAMVAEGVTDPIMMSMDGCFAVALWCENGGEATVRSLLQVEKKERIRLLNFIRDLPWYRTLRLGETEYVMVHGGLEEYDRDKAMEDYMPEELVWYSPQANDYYWPEENKILLVGHTPTFLLKNEKPASIYRGGGNVIFLDCGAAYRTYGGRLGCLCLETGEEFYV